MAPLTRRAAGCEARLTRPDEKHTHTRARLPSRAGGPEGKASKHVPRMGELFVEIDGTMAIIFSQGRNRS